MALSPATSSWEGQSHRMGSRSSKNLILTLTLNLGVPYQEVSTLGSMESNSRGWWLRAGSATRGLQPSSTWPCIHLHIARGCSGTGETELSS